MNLMIALPQIGVTDDEGSGRRAGHVGRHWANLHCYAVEAGENISSPSFLIADNRALVHLQWTELSVTKPASNGLYGLPILTTIYCRLGPRRTMESRLAFMCLPFFAVQCIPNALMRAIQWRRAVVSLSMNKHRATIRVSTGCRINSIAVITYEIQFGPCRINIDWR